MGGRIRSIKSYKSRENKSNNRSQIKLFSAAKAKDLKETPDCSDMTTTTAAPSNVTTVPAWTSSKFILMTFSVSFNVKDTVSLKVANLAYFHIPMQVPLNIL